MSTLPEYPESELKLLTVLFLLKFDDQINALTEEEKFRDASDAYRQDLAETNPAMAHRFEQLTANDKAKAMEMIAIAESVAYVARAAVERAPEYSMFRDKN